MFPPTPPVIKALILLNVVIYILEMIAPEPVLTYLALFTPGQPGTTMYPWAFITYQFTHSPSGLMHILVNMFVLWMFGSDVARRFGTVKFLTFYLLCGVVAGFVHLIVSGFIFNEASMLIGASGSVMGVMVAFAMIDPNRPVYLYFVLPVKVKYLVIGYIALDLFNGLGGSSNVAHFAHLGGAVGGWFLYKHQHDIGLFDFVERQVAKLNSKGGGQYARYRDANTSTKKTPNWWKTAGSKSSEPPSTEDIDRILDKINSKGYTSLTDKEKRDLEEYSRRR